MKKLAIKTQTARSTKWNDTINNINVFMGTENTCISIQRTEWGSPETLRDYRIIIEIEGKEYVFNSPNELKAQLNIKLPDNFINDDVKEAIYKHVSDMADNHIEGWSSRYAEYKGKSRKRRIEEDVYSNHDPSCEIEYVQDQIGRKLTSAEYEFVISEFNKEVIKQLV